MRKTAAFIISQDGNGHRVRCGALMAELILRGWDCVERNGGNSQVTVVDDRDCRVRPDSPKVVVIADTPSQGGMADLLVCGSPGARSTDFLGLAMRRLLVGPPFALLRPEFREWSPDSWHRDKVVGVFDARQVHSLSAAEMAGKFRNALVTITYAGMRALEAACVGAPMVVVPRNEGEELNARGLMAAGAAVISTEAEAENMAKALLYSPAVLRVMSKAARELVDGRGCWRVAVAIEELVQ